MGLLADLWAPVDSFIQAGTSIHNTNKTIKSQKQLAEYSYQKDLDMWNKANAYNSPQAQMERLKSAGLNPNLVYGSGTVAGNSTPAQTPRYQMTDTTYRYQMPRLGDALSMLSAYQDYQYKKAQAEGARLDNVDKAARNLNSGIFFSGRAGLMQANMRFGDAKASAYLDEFDPQTMKIKNEGLFTKQLRRAQYELDSILPARLNVYNSQIQNLKENTLNKFLENRLFHLGFTKSDPAAVRVIMQGLQNKFPKLFAPWHP